jgi:hypothetical protein
MTATTKETGSAPQLLLLAAPRRDRESQLNAQQRLVKSPVLLPLAHGWVIAHNLLCMPLRTKVE